MLSDQTAKGQTFELEVASTSTTALALRRTPPNSDVLNRLTALLEKREPTDKPIWSRAQVAKALGVNPAYISTYARQGEENPPPFQGDITLLEAKLEDFLKSVGEKRELNDATFETSVTRALARFIDMDRSVNGIGVFHGDAGVGKTSGIERYVTANPLSIRIDSYAWKTGKDAILTDIWAQFETRGWKRGESRAEWLVKRLTGRAGAILVDNAHKLTHSALSLLFDLHDRTGVALVLVGNPSIIQKLRQDDQLFSRVGLIKAAKFKKESDLQSAVESLLGREMPEHAGALRSVARKVASERGHLRSLKNHLRVAEEFHKTSTNGIDIRGAFKAAHASLIHEGYSLED